MKYLTPIILLFAVIALIVIGAPAQKTRPVKGPKDPQTNSVSPFITLAWCPVTNAVGYKLYYGYTLTNNPSNWQPTVYSNPITNPCPAVLVVKGSNWLRTYGQVTNVGNVTSCRLTNLDVGRTWYFTVVAYDTNMLESEFSDEIRKYMAPTNVTVNYNLKIRFTSGVVSVQAKIYPYQPYTIFYKNTLTDSIWNYLTDSTSDAAGDVIYNDFSSTNNPSRFYKLSVLL